MAEPDNTLFLQTLAKRVEKIERGGGSGSSGEPPSERISRLEARLDSLLPSLATKGDLSEVKTEIIKWTIVTALSTAAVIISALALFGNKAGQVQPPVVIYPQVPQPQAQTPAPSVPQPTR